MHRQFRPDGPDRLWVRDIAQHRSAEGWVYLAVVIDAFSRRVVGWSIADHRWEISTSGVNGALRLITAVVVEIHDEWAVAERRYLSEESMAKLHQPTVDVIEQMPLPITA